MSRIWLNGALIEPLHAHIDPTDRGLLLGDGLFETLRVAAGVAPHLGRHLARLRTGAAMLGIPLDWSDAAIEHAIAAVAPGDAAARITLTRGPAPRGVRPPAEPHPTLLIAAAPLPVPGPVRLVIARGTTRNDISPLAWVKSLNYLDSILAAREAESRGADDAILLNTRGTVAEATSANIFLWRGDRLLTPPVSDGALPGIARALLIELAGAEEATLFPDDLAEADALFLASSLGLRPVVSLEGKPLGSPTLPTLPWIAT